MAKSLSSAQIDQYRQDGYVYPVDALSATEAQKLREQIEKFEADYGDEAQKILFFKAHMPFGWLSDVIRHPRILDAVEDVLGPDILCWGSSFFQKNAHDPRYVSWHQDTYYYGLEPPETLTVWLSITNSNLESGCVRVIPGSHANREVVAFENTPTENNLLTRGQTIVGVDQNAAVPMVLEPGQFSMHHESIIHGSDANNSDDRRIGLSIHYIPTNVKRVKYNRPGKMPTAALVRGSDRYRFWEHEELPTKDFDAERFEEMSRAAVEFKSRDSDGFSDADKAP